MYTIKHIDAAGAEHIVSVESVAFDREANCLYGMGGTAQATRWTSGLAYVMNEHGKTVSVYNLDAQLGRRDVTDEQMARARDAAHKAAK